MKLLMNNLSQFVQDNQEMTGSDFFFIQFNLCYKCHEVNVRHGGSYIDSPDWIKKKKTTINPKKYG